jgi:hypothetical protein
LAVLKAQADDGLTLIKDPKTGRYRFKGGISNSATAIEFGAGTTIGVQGQGGVKANGTLAIGTVGEGFAIEFDYRGKRIPARIAESGQLKAAVGLGGKVEFVSATELPC